MVDVAQAEERVILTCDRTFIRMGYSDQAFYVRTTNKQEQVKEVLTHFDITVKEDSLLSRCAKCNGTFYPRWACTAVISFHSINAVWGVEPVVTHQTSWLASTGVCVLHDHCMRMCMETMQLHLRTV